MLLRFAKLPQDKKAVVMAAARQSYEEADVAAALRTTYPEGLYTGRSHVAAVDHDPCPEDNDAGDIEDVLLAEMGEGQLGENEDPIEEQDAIDVLMSSLIFQKSLFRG